MQGAFRNLLRGCSRPLDGDDADLGEEGQRFLPRYSPTRYGEMSVVRLRAAVELHAIFRYLQVRWQLFCEALTKFCDLESMLVMCTDDVTWSKYLTNNLVSGSMSQLSANLQTLITQRMSLGVLVERVTQVAPSGLVDLSLDKDGHCANLVGSDLKKAQAALELLLSYRSKDLGTPYYSGRQLVLETHRYTLHNESGILVEEGSRMVLWELHNSSWYVRANINSPI